MTKLEPEEFEAGENVTDQVQRGKPSGIVVSVRLTQEDSIKLIDLAEESGKTISQVAREAIRAFTSYRGQHSVFVPEITGPIEKLNIVAVAPLGPRTAKEDINAGIRVEDTNIPPTSQTGIMAVEAA